jgi:hypothetical protein
MEYDANDVANYAINGDVADLEKAFNAVIKGKINDAIELRKRDLGASIGTEEEE